MPAAPRRIPEQQEQWHGVEDADHSAELERPAPAERRVIGRIAAEAADDDADVDSHLMETDGAGSRVSGVKVRDERQRRGNVEGLADAHERARPQELLVSRDVPGRPGDGRPHQQAAGDDVAAAVAVGDVAADRAEKRIDPLEQREDGAPVGLEPDVGDVAHHRELHRREHLPIEVVEQRDRHEQRDDHPRVPVHGRRGGSHQAGVRRDGLIGFDWTGERSRESSPRASASRFRCVAPPSGAAGLFPAC